MSTDRVHTKESRSSFVPCVAVVDIEALPRPASGWADSQLPAATYFACDCLPQHHGSYPNLDTEATPSSSLPHA